MRYLLLCFTTVMVLLIMAGCSKEEPKVEKESPLMTETKEITIPDDAVTTESGLQYVDLVEGNGSTPQNGQTIVANYTGWLLSGKKFDSSIGRAPLEFVQGSGQVISGWEEGFSNMKVGGKRMLYIPHQLAYGERGYPGVIPPKATLAFEVELLELK